MREKLFVVTSKPAVIAERIIEHFDLTDKFAAVIGPDKSEKSPDKKELIIRAIKHGNIKTLSQVIMIGDRKYDIDGTLVDGNGVIPESAAQAIDRARKNGHKVFICSGRSRCEMHANIMSVPLDGIIGSAGAYVEVDGR